MAIVPDEEIYAWLDEDDSAEANPVIAPVRDAVEKWVKSWCNRNFESQAYKERYHGTGDRRLVLRQYPIISIDRLSLWPVDVLRVTNTLLSTHATVSVVNKGLSTDGVVCKKDSASNTLKFTDYATMTLMANAITALGNGWQGIVQAPTYADYNSNELIPKFGLYCLRSYWAYLQMPYFAEMDFDTDEEKGILTLFRYLVDPAALYNAETMTSDNVGFPRGNRNIFVYYTAGYSADDMPDDLKMAVKIITKFQLQSRTESYFGAKSIGVGEWNMTFEEKEFPKEAMSILWKYKRLDREEIPY